MGIPRVPTKGLGVSEGLEWKISRVSMVVGVGGGGSGMRKRSFQTGLVELESSDLVARRWLGSSQKMVYGVRSPFLQLTFLRCLAEMIVSSRSRGLWGWWVVVVVAMVVVLVLVVVVLVMMNKIG
ncbi:hypothetical protein HanXRQr2_Chr07g0312211 [Helianthus annuus]|uniref:Transmembrane protein n=1 Tax=Helianthus annuus TaxID=4232 RepID=A0A9K3NGY6_HELAN|nr:hypothetical protein HanXRQr2_Chr07g0312211 [Helianthus annuus]